MHSLLRRSGWGVEITRFTPLRFALDSGVDANHRVATLVKKLIQAEKVLSKRSQAYKPSTFRLIYQR
jgi:hypothetical protein